MTIKPIKQIITPPTPHWVGNGFFVHGFFDDFTNDNSPFLLLDYAAPRKFEPSTIQRGVGQHPHKGFETVTIAIRGKVEHKDNHGNTGIIGEGDVQWMTAGSGIMHQEFLEEKFNRKGGEFSMVQLWVNLPAKDKLTKPKYQAISKKDIQVIKVGHHSVSIIAGEFQNTKGAASTFSPVNMYVVDLKSDPKLKVQSYDENEELELSFPADFTTMILVLEGQGRINGERVEESQLITFEKTGETIKLNSSYKTKFLVLSAQPLNESIAHYGPFVMNTQSEILEAIDDFNAGKFGVI
jgi:quercetin 2,3-dioxygenase